MIRPTILLLVLCLAATPASAHWDRTRWGMTPEAVKALYPSATQVTDPDGDPVLNPPAPIVFDGESFSTAQLFFKARGRLSKVVLGALDARDRVPGLMAWLERHHGAPLSVKGPLTAPASGVDMLEAEYRTAEGDKVEFVVLWQGGQGWVAISWAPPAP